MSIAGTVVAKCTSFVELYFYLWFQNLGCSDDGYPVMIHGQVSEISRLVQARELLEQIKSPAKAARIAQSALKLLDQELAEQQRPVAFASNAKRGAAQIEYKVERTGVGENLAEHRPGSKAKPFRCPKHLYDEIAAILAEAATPLTMAEIVEHVAEREGQKPGDHQYRPAMRLWMHVEPPLLMRNRSRYTPSNRQTFVAASVTLWNGLKAT